MTSLAASLKSEYFGGRVHVCMCRCVNMHLCFMHLCVCLHVHMCLGMCVLKCSQRSYIPLWMFGEVDSIREIKRCD